MTGDAEELAFDQDQFDLVVERHVIWTLARPEMALAEWARVLRPAGRIVLIEGDWRRGSRTTRGDYDHIRDQLPLYGGRPAAELGTLVQRAGFALLGSEPMSDADLWGSAPERERYAVLGRRR